MTRKYRLPPFMPDSVTQTVYERWLRRKAQAHVKRDRRRGNDSAIGETYRAAIHVAVENSSSHDAYTGQVLDWSLISKYNNDDSKERGREYKKEFALLPTIDHVGDGTGPADFKICGWRTNDAKHDLELNEFLRVCRSVLEHHGFIVERRG